MKTPLAGREKFFVAQVGVSAALAGFVVVTPEKEKPRTRRGQV
jgi:hypothetical protein